MRLRSLRARLIVAFLGCIAVVFGLGLLLMMTLVHSKVSPRGIHFAAPLVMGGAMMVTGWIIVTSALAPLGAMVAAVRHGRVARVDGEYPSEIAPLVEDLNALLGEREQRVARAVARAGDLAHGLKTPLAIVIQEVGRLEALGHHEIAGTMRGQVERMRRQIDSHLAQARVTAAGVTPGMRAPVAPVANGLVRALERLYADRRLFLVVDVPATEVVRASPEDLEEMLGNLLDNACKWAATRVVVAATRTEIGVVTIDVDDDGAGLNASMRDYVLRRGARADESVPGSGLGLAIVRDLAEAYGGSIALEASALGGVRARLTLPMGQ